MASVVVAEGDHVDILLKYISKVSLMIHTEMLLLIMISSDLGSASPHGGFCSYATSIEKSPSRPQNGSKKGIVAGASSTLPWEASVLRRLLRTRGPAVI